MAKATKKAAEPATDLRLTFLLVVTDLLTYILHMDDRKPADPAAWEALGRVDAQRRQIQRELGIEPTELTDPHGRVSYAKPDDKESQ